MELHLTCKCSASGILDSTSTELYHAASPIKAEQPTSYGVPPPYPPNPFAATQNHNVNDSRTRRDGYESSNIYDHLRRKENENRNGESTCDSFISGTRFSISEVAICRSYHLRLLLGITCSRNRGCSLAVAQLELSWSFVTGLSRA